MTMAHEISLTVNGEEHEAEVESERLLAHTLRDDLGYTGTNIGCETSICGACTIQMNGQAVKACTLFAVQADGSDIQTVEGLADSDGFHPLQESFEQEHGLQCGYCTPGMMMVALDLLEENPDPDREDIRHALEGNLCRCTGYQNIVDAVKETSRNLNAAATDGGQNVE